MELDLVINQNEKPITEIVISATGKIFTHEGINEVCHCHSIGLFQFL